MSRDGEQWTTSNGTKHTVSSTEDPRAPGGYYYSQTDSNGNKATAVYNSNGTLADVPANKDWE